MNHRLDKSRVVLMALAAGSLAASAARIAVKGRDDLEYVPAEPTYGKAKRQPSGKLAKLKKGKARL